MKISKVLSQKEVNCLPIGIHNVGGVVGLCIRKQRTTQRYFLRYYLNQKCFILNLPRSISLGKSRQIATQLRQKLEQGINPKTEQQIRVTQLEEQLKTEILTFKKVSEQWIEYRHGIKFWDDDPKGLMVVQSRLKKYIYPVIGNKKIQEIIAEDIVRILGSITSSKSMSSKVQAILNHIFKWSITKKYREDNPVEQSRILLSDLRIEYKDIRNQPSLDFHEVPSFIKRLMENPTTVSLMLVFSILTCSRSQAVRLMKWEEIDFENKVWNIPEEHDKVKGSTRFRTMMLNEPSLKVLSLQNRSKMGFVFENTKIHQPYSDMCFISFLKRLHEEKQKQDGIGWVDRKTGLRITQHGFRSSFKTWSVSDELGNHIRYNEKVSEYCLLHSKCDPYKGGYERSEYEVSRREMMENWGQWCWKEVTESSGNEC